MDQITLKAYAKVNLTLDIKGRRADGYHLLRSVMQSISLADTVTLQKKSRGQGISIQCSQPWIPTDERNICWRAVEAFAKHAQVRAVLLLPFPGEKHPGCCRSRRRKRRCRYSAPRLNTLYGTGLELAELQQIGLAVGADVPFCLQGEPAWLRIGEAVTRWGPSRQLSWFL